jgi:hypothetical protein
MQATDSERRVGRVAGTIQAREPIGLAVLGMQSELRRGVYPMTASDRVIVATSSGRARECESAKAGFEYLATVDPIDGESTRPPGLTANAGVPQSAVESPASEEDCDCVLEYPSLDPAYRTLVSIDEKGQPYEEMRTPLHRVQDAMHCLLDRLRDRPSTRLGLL